MAIYNRCLAIILILDYLVLTLTQETTTTEKSPIPLIETNIFGFRLWMILGLVLTGLLVIIIILCCVFDCRIPRTKQEIEKDFERRLLAKKMSKHMDSMKPGHNIRITRMPDKRMLKYAAQAKTMEPNKPDSIEASTSGNENKDLDIPPPPPTTSAASAKGMFQSVTTAKVLAVRKADKIHESPTTSRNMKSSSQAKEIADIAL